MSAADCSEDKHRGIAYRYYKGPMGNGGLSTSDNSPGEWSYPSPRSVSEDILKILCDRW